MTKKILISACLLGLPSRYDGRSKPNAKCAEHLAMLPNAHLIPVCPEQLGGLPTPRPPCQIVGGNGFAVLEGQARVLDIQGRDQSRAFLRGAEAVLTLARMLGADAAWLKSKSPSCGAEAPLIGVAAARLIQAGIRVQGF